MNQFLLSDEARSDLFEVWTYVAEDDPRAADQLETDLMNACKRLALQPDLGHRRRSLCADPGVRFLAVRIWYLVVYEIDSRPLRIVRILHGARDVAAELSGE